MPPTPEGGEFPDSKKRHQCYKQFNSGSFPDFIPFYQNKHIETALIILSLGNPLRYEFHIPIVFIIEIDRLVAQ